MVDPKTRKNIARKYGRCFLCLFKGHRASNCNNVRCKNCNGSRHIALCEANLKDDKMHDEKTKETDNELKQVNANVQVTTPSSSMHVGTGSQCGYSLMGEVIIHLLLRKWLVLLISRV